MSASIAPTAGIGAVDAPGSALRKVGGGCLVAGTLLTAGAGIAHPRSGDAHYPRPFLESVIDHRWFWPPDHVVLFFGSLIGISGLFVVASVVVAGAAGYVARGGFAAAILAQALLGGFVAVDGIATPRLAEAWADSSGSARESTFAAARVAAEVGWAFNGLFFAALFGVAFGLYGVALVLDGRYGRRAGAVVPVSFLALVLGIVEVIAGPRLALIWVQNTLMILALVWLAWLGWRLLSHPET